MEQLTEKPHIVVATPLFPPDIAEPAPYAKELLSRLVKTHTVTAVIYGELPEAVAGVEFHCVSKNRPLLWRLLAYTTTLYRVCSTNSLIYAQNGVSVELPTALVSRIRRTPLFIRFADTASLKRAEHNRLFKRIEHFVQNTACEVITSSTTPGATMIPDPKARPEILPFTPSSSAALHEFETSWQNHIKALITLFTSCR